MLIAATQAASPNTLLDAGTVVALVVGLALGYVVGYARAVWVRARAAYVSTKQSVPGLRRTKWEQWRAMVRHGAVALAVVVLAAVVAAGRDGQAAG